MSGQCGFCPCWVVERFVSIWGLSNSGDGQDHSHAGGLYAWVATHLVACTSHLHGGLRLADPSAEAPLQTVPGWQVPLQKSRLGCNWHLHKPYINHPHPLARLYNPGFRFVRVATLRTTLANFSVASRIGLPASDPPPGCPWPSLVLTDVLRAVSPSSLISCLPVPGDNPARA